MPTVSIITALHNKGAYIVETIRSVLAQTIPDWEMLVVENGSTDEGPQLAASFHNERIRLLVSPRLGPSAARNVGLNEARGKWLLFLDADDLIAPDHLEGLLAKASEHPDTQIIAGCWQEFSDGSPSNTQLCQPFCAKQSLENLRDACIAFAPWAIHAAIIDRLILEPRLRWPEELDQQLAEDSHFWFRLIMEHTVSYSDKRGALYRVHTANRRNKVGEIVPWYHGNDNAVAANLRYLEQRGLRPTVGQCENLMRLYSELYWQARSQQQSSIANDARVKAEHWLRASCQRGGTISWTLRARRFLGLRLYLAIRYGLLGKPAHWGKPS